AAAPIGQSTPPKEFDKSGAPLSAGKSDVPMTIQHAPLGESTRSRRRWEPLRTASSSSFPKVAPQTVSKKSAGAFWKTILVLAVAGVIAAAAVVFFLMGE